MVTKVIPFNPGAGAAAGGAALGAQVFGWVLLGLGIIVTTAQAIDLMNQYTEFSGELETSIYYYPDGSWSYGVDMTFVERVRAFLWGDGILSVNSNVPTSSVPACVDAINLCKAHPYACYVDGIGYAYSSIPLILSESGNIVTSTGDYFSQFRLVNNSWSAYKSMPCGSRDVYWFGTSYVDTEYDITLGLVVPHEIPMPDAYPEWHTNARPATNPDTDEEITVLPIPLNPSADPETQIGSVTQPDIWQGALADPMPDTDTNPDTGTDTDPDSPGAPSSDIGDYQIDLKKFFPFCIPFDLYDFFTCLNADPVAPVIEWVIPLPGGGTYPLVIDLSAFDGVAQLLRRLQLLLFCVGLAFKTRDLIKG